MGGQKEEMKTDTCMKGSINLSLTRLTLTLTLGARMDGERAVESGEKSIQGLKRLIAGR